MSAGTYTPARWPICTGPLAYGSAQVTSVLLKFLLIYGRFLIILSQPANLQKITAMLHTKSISLTTNEKPSAHASYKRSQPTAIYQMFYIRLEADTERDVVLRNAYLHSVFIVKSCQRTLIAERERISVMDKSCTDLPSHTETAH